MEIRSTAARLALTLVGESLREISVLVAVFVPLDLFVSGRLLTTRWLAATMGIVFGFFVVGIVLETKYR